MAQLLNLTGHPVSVRCEDGSYLQLPSLGHIEISYIDVSSRMIAVGDQRVRFSERAPTTVRVVTEEPIPVYGSVLVVAPEALEAMSEMLSGEASAHWSWGAAGTVNAALHYALGVPSAQGLIGF